MIEDIAVFIRSDMGVEQPEFAIFEQPISVLEVGPPGAHRLHLRTSQGNTGLKFLQQEVVM